MEVLLLYFNISLAYTYIKAALVALGIYAGMPYIM